MNESTQKKCEGCEPGYIKDVYEVLPGQWHAVPCDGPPVKLDMRQLAYCIRDSKLPMEKKLALHNLFNARSRPDPTSETKN
jgi:hypothetical protein